MNEETKPKLEDFSEAEHAMADRMASPIITSNKANKSFAGQRNRAVWKRMNRPEKMAMIEKGAEKITVFFDKVNPPKETVALDLVHDALDKLEGLPPSDEGMH